MTQFQCSFYANAISDNELAAYGRRKGPVAGPLPVAVLPYAYFFGAWTMIDPLEMTWSVKLS